MHRVNHPHLSDAGLFTKNNGCAVALVNKMCARALAASQDKTDENPAAQFILAELDIISFKSDLVTLEVPIFCLTTQAEKGLWKWQSADGKKIVEVAPGFYGRATQRDKDVLIYCVSHLIQRKNAGLSINKTVRFTANNFLRSMRRGTRGENFEHLKEALDRLKGTQIKTSELLNDKWKLSKGFGLIEEWQILEKSVMDLRVQPITVTLSDWIFNQVLDNKVLTIHPGYFLLRKPLERRLYEIARKHVGRQGTWKIRIDGLKEKCGSSQSRLNEFISGLKKISDDDKIPDYRFLIKDGHAHFYSKDSSRVVKSLVKKKDVDNLGK